MRDSAGPPSEAQLSSPVVHDALHAPSCLTDGALPPRAEHALAKARLAAFEGIPEKCVGFLRTTSENSNWPTSVTSSTLMMRDRRLLDDISSAPSISGEKKRKPDKRKIAGSTAGQPAMN